MSVTRARVSVTGVPSVGAWFVVTSRRDGHRTSGAPGLRVLCPDPRATPPPDMGSRDTPPLTWAGCESSSRWGRGGWEPRRERGGGPGGNQGHSQATTEHRTGSDRGSGSHQPRLPGERPMVRRREIYRKRNDGENGESIIKNVTILHNLHS